MRTTIQWGRLPSEDDYPVRTTQKVLGMPKRFLECPNSPSRRSCVSSLLKSPGPRTPTSRCEMRFQYDCYHFLPILWREKCKSSKIVVWIRSNGEIRKGEIIIISTKYLVPSTWYQVPGTKYLVPRTWGIWWEFTGVELVSLELEESDCELHIRGGRISIARTWGFWWEFSGVELVSLELEDSDDNSRGSN